MTNKIDPCDTMRVNLIAAAVGLQQCTKTATNIVPIPGGDRVIAIGTLAQVRALLADDVDAAAICDAVAAKSRNHLFRSGAKICAGEIRTAQATVDADQVDSEGGHHD